MTKKINGKSKGSTYERKIANLLSERFEEFTGIKQSFRRNIDSGSFFGNRNSYRVAQCDLTKATFGDIIIPEHFNFSIECKHYKTMPNFSSIVKQKVSDWDNWLKQSSHDANNANKKSLLIVKYNNVDDIVFVREKIENISCVLQYKEFFCYTLKDFLSMPNDFFFQLSTLTQTA